MVGFARTTLYRTLEPGGLDAEAEKAQDLAWFDYVAAGPEPRIVVVQDGDTPHAATNALFGEVMSFMHSALGCIGLSPTAPSATWPAWQRASRFCTAASGPTAPTITEWISTARSTSPGSTRAPTRSSMPT